MPTLDELADSYYERLAKAQDDKGDEGLMAASHAILGEINGLTWEETGTPLSSEEKKDLIQQIVHDKRRVRLKKAADNRSLLSYVSYMLSQVPDKKR